MVMPFNNQTGDAEKAYIADALTSSITSDLARIRDAFIVPAATAYSLKDKNLNIPQLGTQAAVRFVLGGSVTGSGDKLRIGATLSDTQTGMQLWTENFDGSLSDLFALQERVTARIGSSIAPQMVIVAARESEKRANTPHVADLLMRALALQLSSQPSLKNLQATTPSSQPRWNFEEIAFSIEIPSKGQCLNGRVPVYRAYNHRGANGDSNHRYTTSVVYYQQMFNQGWNGEGVVMCSLWDSGNAVFLLSQSF